MVQFKAWLLRGLLGLLWVLPVWMNTIPEGCRDLNAVKDQLNSSLRRRYLKHNFPINYTIQVPYEEVFRLRNISDLKNRDESVKNEHLQHLWLIVARAGIKKISRVLPDRHPTQRKYLTNLESLFKYYEQRFNMKISDIDDYPETISDILDRIGNQKYEGWRSVTPKSLIDNCYRTMHCLFKDCFSNDGSNDDYCNIHYWRKRKLTTPQPT